MGREKRQPIAVAADDTLSPAIPSENSEPAAPPSPPRPATRTQDRDPADREAWKRERARQLGHHR